MIGHHTVREKCAVLVGQVVRVARDHEHPGVFASLLHQMLNHAMVKGHIIIQEQRIFRVSVCLFDPVQHVVQFLRAGACRAGNK
eukprot:scaffold551_cov395-Prasinococcus_capsulatus_cf.AAC.5